MAYSFNQMILNMLPYIPDGIVRRIARRYVAGETLNDALVCVRRLNHEGARATIDVLGEASNSLEMSKKLTEQSADVLRQVSKAGLAAGLSVKLSSLGLLIDEEECFSNLRSLLELARTNHRFVRIDMESSATTQKTLDFYERLRHEGFENVGVVIQACLRRSESDTRKLAEMKASVRLCKGIYLENIETAYQDREEIRQNYRRLIRLFIENGTSVAIATHDEVLIQDVMLLLREKKMRPERYEFQMLLGVRTGRRQEIIREGHPLRVYVPFGKDWYAYSLRRLRENPKIVTQVMKSLFQYPDSYQ